ncbi:Ferredoxin [Micromonospora citrea]|uniref:Ferredoxin n=1 Tax=Micromonospora citrea TaxID=47855 RepID=A0A1C6TS80_9ACTN|nr:ferredoxin [Micromonospora citrea]SCL44662.1 Ferredoxin [Micromonospora citrea]
MTVTVDLDLCQNHGQCVYAAPEVFAFDEDEVLTYEPEPPRSRHDQVRAAVAACPVRAIRLVGEP